MLSSLIDQELDLPYYYPVSCIQVARIKKRLGNHSVVMNLLSVNFHSFHEVVQVAFVKGDHAQRPEDILV
jgi:hypothetical protein